MYVNEEIRAVFIVCFESIARERINNVCDVTHDAAIHMIRSYVYTYMYVRS